MLRRKHERICRCYYDEQQAHKDTRTHGLARTAGSNEPKTTPSGFDNREEKENEQEEKERSKRRQ